MRQFSASRPFSPQRRFALPPGFPVSLFVAARLPLPLPYAQGRRNARDSRGTGRFAERRGIRQRGVSRRRGLPRGGDSRGNREHGGARASRGSGENRGYSAVGGGDWKRVFAGDWVRGGVEFEWNRDGREQRGRRSDV